MPGLRRRPRADRFPRRRRRGTLGSEPTISSTPKFPAGLRDRYEPDGLIGAGAMGAVWRVHDLRLDRVVALKQLRQLDAEQTERFRREARTLAALQDPHIVQVLDHGEVDDEVYLVMELVEGRPFDRLGPGVDPLPGWMQVGEALQAVHDQGIVHRDVKPANAVLDRHGRAVLLDFGLVHDPGKQTLTKTGHVIGSLGYMAPELLQGGPATAYADWYSWGASLFHLLEGHLPFDNEAVLAVLEGRPRPDPRFERIGRDHRLRPALELLLQADPRDRPGSWKEVRAVLEDPGEASLQLVGTPTREQVGPSPLLAGGAGGRRTSRTPLVVAGLAMVTMAAFLVTPAAPPEAPPAPASPAAAPEAAGAPEPLRAAAANLDQLIPGNWPEISRRSQREEIDAFVDAMIDPRLPLAYQRHLDQLLAWLEELGADGAHLGARMREPARAGAAQYHVIAFALRPIDWMRAPRSWYERKMEPDPAIGVRLVRLNQADTDLTGRLAKFLLEVQRRHQQLPPLLMATAVLADPMPSLRVDGVDPRPTMVPMALEVPEDTPFAFPISQAAIRQISRQIPDTAVGLTGTRGLTQCAAQVETARNLVGIYRRFAPRLDDQQRNMLLGDAAWSMRECIRRCPPAFQDKVCNAHLDLARYIEELLERDPARFVGLRRRRDDLARTFHEARVHQADMLTLPAGPPD